MTEPISGVAPPEIKEVDSMTVWPTVGATSLGRVVGQLASIRLGFGVFTLGTLLAVATIPLTLVAYAWQLMPGLCRRYTLTNRRVVVRKGLRASEERSIDLDAFDAIDVKVLPGQTWLRSGELVFLREGAEVFRLPGVSRPEPLKHVLLEARQALVSVREVLAQQAP